MSTHQHNQQMGEGSNFVGLPLMGVLGVWVEIGERFQPAESCTSPVSILQKNFR